MDSNVWLYSFTADPHYGESCRAVLSDIEQSKLEAMISVQVVAEISGVLYGKYKVRDTTRHVRGMLSYRMKVHPVTVEIIRLAAEYSRDFRITPYDGIHVATAKSQNADHVISADKELDRVKVITRLDPLTYRSAS